MVLLIRGEAILMIEIWKWPPLAWVVNANREVWRQVWTKDIWCFPQHLDFNERFFCKVRIPIEISEWQPGSSMQIENWMPQSFLEKCQNWNWREINGKSCWQGPFECDRSQLATCVCKVAFGFHEVEHTDHVIPSIVHLINCISFLFLNCISCRWWTVFSFHRLYFYL